MALRRCRTPGSRIERGLSSFTNPGLTITRSVADIGGLSQPDRGWSRQIDEIVNEGGWKPLFTHPFGIGMWRKILLYIAK
jgi:hypothetical protein